MKVHYKGETYNVRWTAELDAIIIRAAKKYRDGGVIRWSRAMDDGALKGLPVYLSLKNISQRYSAITHKKKPSEWIYHTDYSTQKKRRELFRDKIPDELKRKHGWKPREKWTNKQRRLLLYLASLKKYRKSKVTVDWVKLVQDERVQQLPFQDAYKLCKYYGSLQAKAKPGYIKKHREEALAYKRKNRKEYRAGQGRRKKIMNKAVNEFLLDQLEKR